MPKEARHRPRKHACLECRLNKIKCIPGSSSSCQRCEKYDFTCRTEVAKPGRKPKSKVEGLESNQRSVKWSQEDTSDVDPAKCASAFANLIRNSVGTGSTYTFVSAGEADVSSMADNASSVPTPKTTPPATLTQLLRPLSTSLQHRHQLESDRLPANIDFKQARYPIEANVVTNERAAYLYHYFLEHLTPWLGVLDASMDISTSPFLHTVVLLQASRYCHDYKTEEVSRLSKHVRMLSVIAFAEGDISSESILAFYLAAIWKSPNDSLSDLYTGCADRMSLMQQKGSSRQFQRLEYFHYIQQNVFLLHYSPTSALFKRDDLQRSCHIWALHPEALIGDWWLSSDVESTAIQSNYKMLFEQQNGLKHASSSTSLLEAFLLEVQSWEQRWFDEAKRKENPRRDKRGYMMRMAGFRTFRHSVCLQISSIALRQALQRYLSSKDRNVNQMKRSFEVCLDSAMGIMNATLDLESDPMLLLHMPDSLVVLVAHASLLIVYLLLVPFVPSSEASTLGVNVSAITQISLDAFSSCLSSMQRVHSLLQAAATTRPQVQSAITLCRDYIASLLAILQGCLREDESNAPWTQLNGMDMFTSVDGNQVGWDWLEALLSNTSSQL